MSRTTRQLVDLGHQIDALRNDLQQSNDQFVALEEMAEDARIRAMISETPAESISAHEMQAAKERLEGVIRSMNNELDQLLIKRDELLEKLFEESQQG